MSSLSAKTAVVLGGAYGGARAAQLLASGLNKEWKVVLIDKNSHANHVYIFPRVAVLPGHEHKAFVPYTHVFSSPDTTPGPCAQVFIQGTVTAITPSSVTFRRQNERINEEHVNYGFLVYALGSQLPAPVNLWGPPLALSSADFSPIIETEHIAASNQGTLSWLWQKMPSPFGFRSPVSSVIPADTEGTRYTGNKADAMMWLQRSQKIVESAASVLVVGGGALGIQFATDIASVYPTKEVTLVHSRGQLLSRFDSAMHSEILLVLESLGINVILNDRVILEPGVVSENGERVIKTRNGREIRADLIMLCTGQKPNTQLISQMDPSVISDPSTGLIKVSRTMQVQGYSHIFAVGDVADAFGAIKAGHTAYWQAGVAVRNILKLIQGEGETLEDYVPGAPAIKVTLGLRKNATQADGVVVVKEDGVDDFEAKGIWAFFGYKVDNDEDMYD